MIIKRNSQKKLNRIQPHLPQQPVEQISQEQIEEQLQDSSSLQEENIQQQSQPEKEEEKTFDIFEGFNFVLILVFPKSFFSLYLHRFTLHASLNNGRKALSFIHKTSYRNVSNL